jgi:hypothetical protein
VRVEVRLEAEVGERKQLDAVERVERLEER